MGASLIQPCRVDEEGPRVVNVLSMVKIMTVAIQEAPANFVPAAAVIRKGQALFGITGRKAHVGGIVSWG